MYLKIEILQSDWPTPFWPCTTEKQTNRFTDFRFGLEHVGEVRWKKTKNRFYDLGQILAWC